MRALVRCLVGLVLCQLAGCALFRGPPGSDALDLSFEGNATFSERKLRNAIAVALEEFEESAYPKSAVDDMAYEVERFYRAEGFPFATVGYRFQEHDGARASAVLEIDEGARTEIASITFDGNTVVSARTLREFFRPTKKKLFGKAPHYYVESEIESARDEIVRDYLARGWLDVVVSDPITTFEAERTRARVHLTIVEGRRYVLGDVEFEGDLVFPLEEHRALITPFVDQPYSHRVSVEIQGRIRELYLNRGFPDVQVEQVDRTTSDAGRIALRFEIVAGLRIEVAAIGIRGNEKTRTEVVRERLRLEAGDVYSAQKERESQSRLYQTGLFETVEMTLVPVEDSNTERKLEVAVKESDSLEVFVEPGYGSYEEWRISGGVRERNLLGRGLILQAEGTLAHLAQRGELSLIDPWFLGSDVSAELSLFGNAREEPTFDRDETGFGLDFRKRYRGYYETGVGYQFRRSAISNIETIDPDVLDALDDVNISSIALAQTYDARDDVINTNAGLLSKVTIEYADAAIGSELDFIRTRLTQNAFVAVDEDTTLALSLRTGLIAPIHSTDTIPLQERFFNGGENTVRSFGENEVGPEDTDGNPTGGEAATTLSLEYRRNITGRFYGALFYDLGNVVEEYQDYLDMRGFEQAIGIGVRYALPIGPVRLDWGVNPDPDDGESRSVLHFSVGMAF